MTQPRETLGRYRLGSELGRGAYATVFRAHDPELRREVALKALAPDLARDATFYRRFLAEGRALAALQHPHIIPVYDVGQDGERPYFTMELIRGGTLSTLIVNGEGVQLSDVLVLVEQLASALDYLHGRRLVHRDVKTDNVMLRGPNEIVLMDLGIARNLDASRAYTLVGKVLGTPEAMAPEQVLGERVEPPADLYALGILTYKLLAGRPPFVGDIHHLMYAQAQLPPPPLAGLCPGLPERVYAAVAAALAKEPAQRPPSAAAFVAMLSGRSVLPIELHGTTPSEPADPTVLPTSLATTPATTTLDPRDARRADEGLLAAPPSARASRVFWRRRGVRLGLGLGLIAATVGVGGVVFSVAGQGHLHAHAGVTPTAVVAAQAPPPSVRSTVAVASITPLPADSVTPTPTAQATSLPAVFTWTVDTLAGGGSAGAGDGEGAAAQFAYPQAVAVAATGDLYVADLQNDTIRQITTTGVTTRFAGTAGRPGYTDGPAQTATFNLPDGIAVDHAGNVYVADLGNERIRKIDPAGTVTTLAGSGVAGFADGPADEARFNEPAGLAVDASGNVYVADLKNNRIRKIAPDGSVTTAAGTGEAGMRDGAAGTALFNAPSGIAVAADGAVYIADYYNNRIRKLAPDGMVTTVAGASDAGASDGPGVDARFNGPTRLAIDPAGGVVVADLGNESIRYIDPDGVVTTLAGSGATGLTDGAARASAFNQPEAVAVSADGVIYIADGSNNAVRRLRLLPAQ